MTGATPAWKRTTPQGDDIVRRHGNMAVMDFAFTSLKKMKPRNIFDMSLVTACIRPSGESYRDELLARKRNINPSKKIDELLDDSFGWLVYQEQTISFLQKICGLSGSDADTVRRAIGKKDRDTIEKWLPIILEGYCSNSEKSREEAEEEAKQFLKVIEDASAYSFGYNHSVAYCLLGYLCAYYRYYHPVEFITALLNNAANDEDIANGTALANLYGIRITPPVFGSSRDGYSFDLENKTISKGISSIKFMNSEVSEELYAVSKSIPENGTFVDVLKAVKSGTTCDARQLDILISLDYFRAYGNIAELNAISWYFDFLDGGAKRTLKKEKVEMTPMEDYISRFATDIGKNGNELESWQINDCEGLLRECERYVYDMHMPDWSVKEKIDRQMMYLNYISMMTGEDKDRNLLYVMAVRPLVSKKTNRCWAYMFQCHSVGSGKENWYTVRRYLVDTEPVAVGDSIRVFEYHKEKGQYWYIDNYKIAV